MTELVSFLNAFTPDYTAWHLARARKQHEDIFGETIDRGEYYYTIQHGAAFNEVIKMSKLSMERVCFVVFESARTLGPLAKQILQMRHDQMMEKLNKIK